jgi:hypothetical protein
LLKREYGSMKWQEYLSEAREKYVAFYRSAIKQSRQEGKDCTPEVWIEPNVPPGKKRPPQPLCVDILVQAPEGPQMAMVAGEPVQGPLVEKTVYGRASLRVYELTWEQLSVWVRHPEPDWALLEPWTKKWMNPELQGNADNDGLTGIVHYIGSPTPEGGGYLYEMDFGSAPVEAITELMDIFRNMGATGIELGRSDGSDMPASVLAALREPELTLQTVAKAMIEATMALGGVREVRQLSPEQLEIFMNDDKDPRIAFLGNVHRMLQRVGVEVRPRELYRFARGQRETMHLETPDLEQLRLTIKDNRFLENVREQAPTLSLLARKWVADLWLVTVWDGPNGMRFAISDEPAKYGMSAEEMMQRARENGVEEHPPAEVESHGPIWAAHTGDCYDASLLLDDAWVAEMATKAKGSLLACVPARHVVLLGDSANPKCLAEMQKVAAQVEDGGDHLISGTILVRMGSQWEEWAPENAAPRFPPRTPTPSPPKKPWWKLW